MFCTLLRTSIQRKWHLLLYEIRRWLRAKLSTSEENSVVQLLEFGEEIFDDAVVHAVQEIDHFLDAGFGCLTARTDPFVAGFQLFFPGSAVRLTLLPQDVLGIDQFFFLVLGLGGDGRDAEPIPERHVEFYKLSATSFSAENWENLSTKLPIIGKRRGRK